MIEDFTYRQLQRVLPFNLIECYIASAICFRPHVFIASLIFQLTVHVRIINSIRSDETSFRYMIQLNLPVRVLRDFMRTKQVFCSVNKWSINLSVVHQTLWKLCIENFARNKFKLELTASHSTTKLIISLPMSRNLHGPISSSGSVH